MCLDFLPIAKFWVSLFFMNPLYMITYLPVSFAMLFSACVASKKFPFLTFVIGLNLGVILTYIWNSSVNNSEPKIDVFTMGSKDKRDDLKFYKSKK